jgi:uncharacterized membrane protein YhhN
MAGFLGVGLGLIGLVALLVSERSGNSRARLAWKTFTSACFILSALSQGIAGRYDVLVLAGLAFGFLGDVLLALRGQSVFLVGMVAFAVGHALYAVAFVTLGALEPFPMASTALVGLIECGVLAWLWPHLGNMRAPVAVYVTIIALMLIAASGTLTLKLAGQGRWLIASGAAFFAISDVFVAQNRFVGSGFSNKLVGLPVYYAGQFLIAFSVGFF